MEENDDSERAAAVAKVGRLEADLRALQALLEPAPTLGDVLVELRAIKGLLQELVNLKRMGT